MEINGVQIDDTFAEAFPIKMARVQITAVTERWALEAAREATGFGTSVIGCSAEAGIECIVDGSETVDGRPGANILICNDYEFELIRTKTGLSEADVLSQSEALVITRGAQGSSIVLRDRVIDVPAVPEDRIIDPTGVGDAYRGGFMKGLANGADWQTCGRLGSVAATYALEHVGGMSHTYTWHAFKARYEANFGALSMPS